MALMPDPVWNFQTTLPVSTSTAMNSPVSFPVNSRPPPVASIADQIWKSISGVRHFFCAVSGSIAFHVADWFVGRPRERQVVDELVALANHVGLYLQVLVYS